MRPANESDDRTEPIEAQARMLRNLHRGVLGTLALCFLVMAAAPGEQQPGPPTRGYTVTAVMLAVLAIGARAIANRPKTASATSVRLQLMSLLLATAIGLVGVAIALGEGLRQGLFYPVAGALLAIWPPVVRTAPED